MKKLMYACFCSIRSIKFEGFNLIIIEEAMSTGFFLNSFANWKQGNAKSPRWGSGGVSKDKEI